MKKCIQAIEKMENSLCIIYLDELFILASISKSPERDHFPNYPISLTLSTSHRTITTVSISRMGLEE
jgi:hypothetical protein